MPLCQIRPQRGHSCRRMATELQCFSQLLEETEHFCGCSQEKVAKIVQCGEPFYF